ncbi:MAG TPA: DUF4352 domain-containing protein [Bryobacteraceae bacterium]
MIKTLWCALLLPLALFVSGCQKNQLVPGTPFAMGERVPVGQMTYSVVESAWKTQLGESFKVRSPENRFLLLTLSVTNGTGQDVSIPLLTLEGPNGQTYRELTNGEGLVNWFGLLRTISPAQTQQGMILFDVPLTSYKLRIPDVNDPGLERYVTVQIPLSMNSDVPIQSPITPDSLK